MKAYSPACRALCAVLLGLSIGVCGAAGAQCSAPVRMATGQVEPYGYYDAQKRYVGIDPDMVRAIFAEAGCTVVEMALMPDSRNLLLFEQGRIGMLTGVSRTPERMRRAWFSAAYREETIGLFVAASTVGAHLALASFADVVSAPVTLLAPRVGWYGEQFERHRPSLKASGRLFQFDNLAQGVRMLAAGRAQLMLGDAAGIEHAAARLGVQVRPLPFWLVQAPVHLMFSRASITAADVAHIDSAIDALRKRGVLEQIERSHGDR